MYTAEYIINKNKEKIVREKLLTIGIITKNECEKLERCLKSLMPLKDAFDCEIIVTDTGSTDNTVEMAKKYADQILHFEWNNDFAAARNTGIKAAKGLWFMWIDSDEWLENPEELIEFFKSGDYKRYGAASFKFCDYVEESIFNENASIRMTLKYRNIFFEGIIHEQLNIISNNYIYIDSTIFHDGYFFYSEDERKRKYERNIKNLLERLDKDIYNLDIIKYIATSYTVHNESHKAIEYCDKAIILISKNKNILSIEQYGLFLSISVLKAWNLFTLKKYEETLYILLELKNNYTELNFLFLSIYYLLSETYEKLNKKENQYYFAKKYIDLYLEKNNFNKDYMIKIECVGNRKDIFSKMIDIMINNFADLEQDENIIFYLDKIILMNKEESQGAVAYISKIFDTITRYKRFFLIKVIYLKIEDDILEFDKDNLENHIIQYLTEYPENTIGIFEALSELDNHNKFIKFCKYKYYDLIGDEDSKVLFMDFLENKEYYTSKDLLFKEVLNGIIKYKLEPYKLENALSKFDLFCEESFVNGVIGETKNDILNSVIEYVETYENELSFRQKYFMVSSMERLVIGIEYLNLKIKVYDVFCRLVPKLKNEIYSKSFLTKSNIDVMPPLFRFGYYIELASKYKVQNRWTDYIVELKNAVREYPIMKDAVMYTIKEMEVKLNEEKIKALELEKLTLGVKNKIYELINYGQYEEAINVICQLQSIIPDDKELKELKSRIISK